MADEDFFSDDDLDDIPDNTLRELEDNAISSTQKPQTAPVQPKRKPVYGTAPLNRAGTTNRNLPWRPPQPKPPTQFQQRSATPAGVSGPPSSDYGFDDEDVIDLNEPPVDIRPALHTNEVSHGHLRPSATVGSVYDEHSGLDPETEAAYAAADAELGAQWAHAPHLAPKTNDNIDVSSLQARIAELEAEQIRLRKAEEDARNAATARQGEIAIVRANQEKATREYERRIEVMRRTHADDAAKQKAELEAGRKEREKMQTDNRFLQHDLAQEAERAKRANGASKARTGSGRENLTPRKSKRTGLGDGFDDDEVRLVSPSKSKDRQKDATPKHATKRKRTANDSPMVALSFTQPLSPLRQESSEQPQATPNSPTNVLSVADDRFEWMQRILNHCPYHGHARSLEALGKHTFSSDSNRTVSSMLLDILSRPATSEPEYFPMKLARALLKLWSRCSADKMYAPLYLIVDLINFALFFELAPVIAQLIEEAVPLCMKTVDVIAVPMGRASINPTFAASLDRGTLGKLIEEIDMDEIMELLLRLAQAASLTLGRVEVFWQHVDLHFTLLMLNKAQTMSQITTTLQILATSTLSTTFGPICDDVEQQPKQEMGVVDRLTSLLFEIPQPPEDEPVYTEAELAELRIEILKVLRAMCQTDHGGALLAHSTNAIGRLVRFLNAQVNKLYTLPNSFRQEDSAHSLISATINTTTRLLHYLLRNYAADIDLVAKFKVIHGGYDKFLLCMSRIAFAEQLVFERGIEDASAEAAHEILNDTLSPEEGEAIARAWETPRASGGGGGREVDMREPD